jgi:hypothetical protein
MKIYTRRFNCASKRPWCQLVGCFHFVISRLRMLATVSAKKLAFALLSPSMTNYQESRRNGPLVWDGGNDFQFGSKMHVVWTSPLPPSTNTYRIMGQLFVCLTPSERIRFWPEVRNTVWFTLFSTCPRSGTPTLQEIIYSHLWSIYYSFHTRRCCYPPSGMSSAS